MLSAHEDSKLRSRPCLLPGPHKGPNYGSRPRLLPGAHEGSKLRISSAAVAGRARRFQITALVRGCCSARTKVPNYGSRPRLLLGAHENSKLGFPPRLLPARMEFSKLGSRPRLLLGTREDSKFGSCLRLLPGAHENSKSRLSFDGGSKTGSEHSFVRLRGCPRGAMGNRLRSCFLTRGY